MKSGLKLSDFIGNWSISREITDKLSGQIGRFEGSVRLTTDPDGLVSDETGQLTLGDAAPMQAVRRYFWRPSPDGISVFFDDGRFFHHIDADTMTPSAHHDCPPDSYDVAYDFTDWPRWSSVWTVAGPCKDYVMRSLYARLD